MLSANVLGLMGESPFDPQKPSHLYRLDLAQVSLLSFGALNKFLYHALRGDCLILYSRLLEEGENCALEVVTSRLIRACRNKCRNMCAGRSR